MISGRGSVGKEKYSLHFRGRAIAAEKYPLLFPDHDAGRIVKETGVDWSDKKLYWFQAVHTHTCAKIKKYLSTEKFVIDALCICHCFFVRYAPRFHGFDDRTHRFSKFT